MARKENCLFFQYIHCGSNSLEKRTFKRLENLDVMTENLKKAKKTRIKVMTNTQVPKV